MKSKECGRPPFVELPAFCLCSAYSSFIIYLILGAFEIEINGQLVFSKLENGGFPYEKDVSTCNTGNNPTSACPSKGHIIPFHISAL